MSDPISIPFTFVPDAGGYSPSIEPAVTRVAFGGGYVQTSARGINLDGAKLNLTFSMRSKVEIDAIIYTLKQAVGNRITFTLADETTERLWDVISWTPPVPQMGGQVWSVSVVLQETFEGGSVSNPLLLDFATSSGWEDVSIANGVVVAYGQPGLLMGGITTPTVNVTPRYIRHAIPKQGSWSIDAYLTLDVAVTYAGISGAFLGVLCSRTGVHAVRIHGAQPGTNWLSDGAALLPAAITWKGGVGSPDPVPYRIRVAISATAQTVTVTGAPKVGDWLEESYTYTFAQFGGAPDYLTVGFIGDDCTRRTLAIPSITVEAL